MSGAVLPGGGESPEDSPVLESPADFLGGSSEKKWRQFWLWKPNGRRGCESGRRNDNGEGGEGKDRGMVLGMVLGRVKDTGDKGDTAETSFGKNLRN